MNTGASSYYFSSIVAVFCPGGGLLALARCVSVKTDFNAAKPYPTPKPFKTVQVASQIRTVRITA